MCRKVGILNLIGSLLLMFNVFALKARKVHYQSSLRHCLTAPAASKNCTDVSNDFTNAIDTRISSSQNIFNTLQPGSREEAVSSSSQNVSEASGAICKYIQIQSFQNLFFHVLISTYQLGPFVSWQGWQEHPSRWHSFVRKLEQLKQQQWREQKQGWLSWWKVGKKLIDSINVLGSFIHLSKDYQIKIKL